MGTLAAGIKDIFSPEKNTGTNVMLCGNDGTPDGHITFFNLIKESITDDAQIGFGYAVCSTASNVAAKEVTIPNFAIKTGAIVSVLFQNGFTTSNSTLNVSGTGAKPIYYRGATISPLEVVNGMVAILQYDGTNWNAVSIERIVRNYGDDWVDLGLPSGTLWRKYNIGANSLSGFGKFYEITNIEGYTQGDTYPGDYSNSPGASIHGNIPLSNDPAHIELGSPWRIPSLDDWNDMYNNTNHIEKTVDGITGGLFVSKTNGNSIFIPYSGYYMTPADDSPYTLGEPSNKNGTAYYHSSSYESSQDYYRRFCFKISNNYLDINTYRQHFLMPIRPVQ